MALRKILKWEAIRYIYIHGENEVIWFDACDPTMATLGNVMLGYIVHHHVKK